MIISVVQFQIFFLALTRVLAILIQVPVLGGNNIPAQTRIAFGIVLTAILVPWQPAPADAAMIPLLAFAFSILREMIIGLLAGFAANLTFGTIQIAGEMMSTAAGFSSGRMLNPLIGDSSSAFDQMFIMIALMIFLGIDGHHVFIAALKRTFDLIPVNSALPAFLAMPMINLFAQLVAAGIQMALPVMGALFLTDISLGLLARVAPQVQVFFIGMPAKVALGLMALSLTLAILMPTLEDYMRAIGPWMLKLLGS
jgi:flagellar biosynthesis protein FliR